MTPRIRSRGQVGGKGSIDTGSPRRIGIASSKMCSKERQHRPGGPVNTGEPASAREKRRGSDRREGPGT